MDHRPSINELLNELGKTLSLEQLQLGQEDGCVLLFEDNLALTIEYDENAERLVFSIHVAKLPEENTADVLQELLAANCYWLATGGATLGLQSSTRAILLMYASRVADLDVSSLERIVENLLSMTEHWRERIELLRSGAAPRTDIAPEAANSSALPLYG